MAKKFKRYYTGHDNKAANGKGSWRRDTQVSEEQFAANWERIFGRNTEKADVEERSIRHRD
jgi:hypothetical protein